MGVDELGVDEMGVDNMGSRRSGMIAFNKRNPRLYSQQKTLECLPAYHSVLVCF